MQSRVVIVGLLAASLAACGGDAVTLPNGVTMKFARLNKKASAPQFSMLVTGVPSASDIEKAAREHCTDTQMCDVFAWADPSLVGSGYPLTAREAAGVIYIYDLSRFDGKERSLFDCRRFRDLPKDKCIEDRDRKEAGGMNAR